jgi:hypothetical protein
MPAAMTQRDAVRSAFLKSFRRSKRGNLWTRHEGRFVCVFRHEDTYGWCVSDEDDDRPQFSQQRFGSEWEALLSLADEVGL